MLAEGLACFSYTIPRPNPLCFEMLVVPFEHDTKRFIILEGFGVLF